MRVFVILFFISTQSWAQLTHKEYLQAHNQFIQTYKQYLQVNDLNILIMDLWNKKDYATASNAYRALSLQVSGDNARRAGMNFDSYMLLLCHEMGHATSYAPASYFDPGSKLGSSYEGQADYYSTLVCFRKVFASENRAIDNDLLPKKIIASCKKVYAREKDFNLCKRAMLASENLIKSYLGDDQADLLLKDGFKSYGSDPYHPNAQCRLDTLKAGILCPIQGELSYTHALYNTCSSKKYPNGARPQCWFDEEDLVAQDAALIILQ